MGTKLSNLDEIDEISGDDFIYIVKKDESGTEYLSRKIKLSNLLGEMGSLTQEDVQSSINRTLLNNNLITVSEGTIDEGEEGSAPSGDTKYNYNDILLEQHLISAYREEFDVQLLNDSTVILQGQVPDWTGNNQSKVRVLINGVESTINCVGHDNSGSASSYFNGDQNPSFRKVFNVAAGSTIRVTSRKEGAQVVNIPGYNKPMFLSATGGTAQLIIVKGSNLDLSDLELTSKSLYLINGKSDDVTIDTQKYTYTAQHKGKIYLSMVSSYKDMTRYLRHYNTDINKLLISESKTMSVVSSVSLECNQGDNFEFSWGVLTSYDHPRTKHLQLAICEVPLLSNS